LKNTHFWFQKSNYESEGESDFDDGGEFSDDNRLLHHAGYQARTDRDYAFHETQQGNGRQEGFNQGSDPRYNYEQPKPFGINSDQSDDEDRFESPQDRPLLTTKESSSAGRSSNSVKTKAAPKRKGKAKASSRARRSRGYESVIFFSFVFLHVHV
jgi:hypothetical protein